MIAAEIHRAAGDGACFAAGYLVEIFAVFSQGADLGVAIAGLPGGCPEYVRGRIGDAGHSHQRFRCRRLRRIVSNERIGGVGSCQGDNGGDSAGGDVNHDDGTEWIMMILIFTQWNADRFRRAL